MNSELALAERVLALCDAAERDNYGREAVDVSDLREALGGFLGARGDDDLHEALRDYRITPGLNDTAGDDS